MTKKVEVTTIDMVGEARELTPEAVRQYFLASLRVVPFLQRRVINPIEEALKVLPGFTDEKRPDPSPNEYRHKMGDVTFTVTTKATTKTPSYQEVYDDLNNYLAFLRMEKEDGKQVPCVRTIEDRLYVQLNDVLVHIDAFTDKVIKEGISQSLGYVAPPRLEENLNTLVVPLRNYRKLPPGSGAMYVQASLFAERAKELAIVPFERALKEESGYSKLNIPAETEESYIQVGPHLFCVQSIPSNNPDYKGIIDALVLPVPEKRSKKQPGELTLVHMGVDDQRVEIYIPRQREEEWYVSLLGLQQRIEQLTTLMTKREIRQPIYHYPVV
ncbi:hypothetical protein HY488_00440 [Candidatus Woesearchaeota archaeon]|nr:hypothetical protein [Candidatus Woesearchaeota archaeon]